MTGDEIREAFLSFFESKGHLRIPSSSLIPAGDPTLLLTNAGMVQLKPYFTGEMQPPGRRLTSSQKCFRTTDVGQVGDATHLTFFEMLGNFSVGDYFKEDAIRFAWEFVTERLGLEPDRIWASVFRDDDEAFHLWTTRTGVPAERIRRFDEQDNFWGPAGSEGPCGPCSEIHYDFGADRGCLRHDCGPNCENTLPGGSQTCDRFIEMWNLVFMQFYQDAAGERTPLPAPNIDTGMGLERAAVILQGKRSIYETDLFDVLVRSAAELCGRQYGRNPDDDYALRVVAEHARSAAFLICDGVVPGNGGRNYVLRRVIRRAIRYGRKLGLEDAFLAQVAEVVIDRMGAAYPDLLERREFILRVMGLEEERFGHALRTGLPMLEDGLVPFHLGLADATAGVQDEAGMRAAVEALAARVGGSAGSSLTHQLVEGLLAAAAEIGFQLAIEDACDWLSGIEAFVLYDTYGLPPELVEEIAQERGLVGIDWDGFREEMEAQRARAGASAERFGGEFDAVRVYQELGVEATRFHGYETLETRSVIVGMVVDGMPVERAVEGRQVEVLLSETPFYAELGGQVGDTGSITAGDSVMEVEDTQSPVAGLAVHRCRVTSGSFTIGDSVDASVDARRRASIARNHTATHLLHATLRNVLGFHVRQHGSLVAPDRLRFDFTHVSPLTREELLEVQRLANEKIRENVAVIWHETTYRDAVADGALAFFGDRYGDRVRVVEVANGAAYSVEVCGGTHVHRTGDIGFCHVVSETGIGSGLRRIEAVTGSSAEALMLEQAAELENAAGLLEGAPGELVSRVEGLLSELRSANRRADTLERELLRRQVGELPRSEIEGVAVVSGVLTVSNVEFLREAGDWLRNDIGSGIVILGSVIEGRPAMMAMATRDIAESGFDAGGLVREAAKEMGGGGGGRADLGQAGGRYPDKLPDAIRAAEEGVRAWREAQS